ncbi:hypothetical protein FISHEDRAFT_17598, partial [Fistulina hepatica ATCC 64428]
TLISASHLDKAGFSLHFSDGLCTIRAPPAIRTVNINELHCIMGHVNHRDLKNGIQTGQIIGVNLDPTIEPTQCDGCIEAKAACHPFPRVHEDRTQKY